MQDDLKTITKDSVVLKHSALIQMSNEYTRLQRMTSNIMLYNAYDDLLENKTHKIKVSDLKRELGVEDDENCDANKEVKRMVKGLIKPIVVDILRKTKEIFEKSGMKEDGITIEEGGQVLLTLFEVVNIRKRGVIEYRYNPYVKQILHNPEIYAKLKLSMQQKFLSKYALALYEICFDYIKISQTPEITLPDLKRLLVGEAPKKTYKQFKFFNSKVLKPAVDNINADTDIQISPTLIKEGRLVIGVKFYIHHKEEISAHKPIASSQASDEHTDNRDKVEALVEEILYFTGHEKSREFYFKVAWKLVLCKKEALVRRAISEIKADFQDKEIQKNKAALFNFVIQRLSREHHIDLELNKTKRPRRSPSASTRSEVSLEKDADQDHTKKHLEALEAKKKSLFSFPS